MSRLSFTVCSLAVMRGSRDMGWDVEQVPDRPSTSGLQRRLEAPLRASEHMFCHEYPGAVDYREIDHREVQLVPRKPYDAELADLERPFGDVARWAGIDALRELLMTVSCGPALFVGTGGTLAVARFAAMLHEQVVGQPARAVTPLELAMLSPMSRSGAVLFSAGLSHPDALGALGRLANSRLRPAGVVTFRDGSTVDRIVPTDVQPVVLPTLEFREGFLATTSVLVMVAALLRAYGGDEAIPASLPRPTLRQPTPTEQLLVLTTPSLAAVATDIETRFHELGLASVQVTDYRNFAHGRHVGLLRRAKNTSVLGLVDRSLERLAMATLDVLPGDEIDVTTWKATCDGPAATIELLVASMELASTMAAGQGVNVARPGAAPFGRRLYHLPLGRLLPRTSDGPVERKLQALVAGLDVATTRAHYDEAFHNWRLGLAEQTFAGVVLDYDGTVCATSRRYDLPNGSVQASLADLLERGVVVGFASGRGPSLCRDLRQWVPRHQWPHVLVGIYNGGVCVALEEDLPDLAEPSPQMVSVVDRLKQLPITDALVIEPRAVQVTVSIRPGAYGEIGRLAQLIVDAMAQPPELPVRVVRSGHSVDITSRMTSKRSVIDRVTARTGRPSLVIGDQGDVGGNDFDLLASSPWTLTVDRCSADPTRCWYLDTKGRSGPTLLSAYLDALAPSEGGFGVNWSGP